VGTTAAAVVGDDGGCRPVHVVTLFCIVTGGLIT
jgi:hypothetical protein